MKITGRLKGIGFAVAAFFIGRAFVMNLNPFAIGALVAWALLGENIWLIFIGLMGGIASLGSFDRLFEYGSIMLFLIVILALKNSIELRGRNILTALITGGVTFVIHGISSFVVDEYVSIFDMSVMAVLSFASALVFYKGIEGLKEDSLSIVTDNETALGFIAFFAAVFWGMPLEVYLKHMINTKFIKQKERPYQTNNFYSCLHKQRKIEKEVRAIVKQDKTKRKKKAHS